MLWIVNAIVLTRPQPFAITLAVVVIDQITIQYKADEPSTRKRVPVVPATVQGPILARQITGRLRSPVAMEAMVLGLALASVPVRLGPLIAAILAIAGILFAARLLKLR
jgi:hypothetical protein